MQRGVILTAIRSFIFLAFLFFFARANSSRTKTEKSLHRPGIEPGSVPWQGTILPLDHRCFFVYWLLRVATQVIYSFGNFWTHNPSENFSPAKNVNVFHSSVSTEVPPPRADAAAELSPNCTLNPKPNTPPCFRVKLLFEC